MWYVLLRDLVPQSNGTVALLSAPSCQDYQIFAMHSVTVSYNKLNGLLVQMLSQTNAITVTTISNQHALSISILTTLHDYMIT